MAHYYAQRKSIKDGNPATPINKYGTRTDMEYQYHLFCASAVKNESKNEFDAVEWGTLEQGVLERKTYKQEIEPEEVSEE